MQKSLFDRLLKTWFPLALTAGSRFRSRSGNVWLVMRLENLNETVIMQHCPCQQNANSACFLVTVPMSRFTWTCTSQSWKMNRQINRLSFQESLLTVRTSSTRRLPKQIKSWSKTWKVKHGQGKETFSLGSFKRPLVYPMVLSNLTSSRKSRSTTSSTFPTESS